MTVLRRSLIAIPVAGLATALFVATSPPEEWEPWTADRITENIVLDEDGYADGLIEVVVVGTITGESELRITLINEDARRSFTVAPADRSLTEGRVKDGYEIYRGLPNTCEEFDPESSEPLTVCTVDVEVLFEGGRDNVEEVTIDAAVGAWGYNGAEAPDDPHSIEVRYDADPPEQDG